MKIADLPLEEDDRHFGPRFTVDGRPTPECRGVPHPSASSAGLLCHVSAGESSSRIVASTNTARRGTGNGSESQQRKSRSSFATPACRETTRLSPE
jgi:hypothetical protein